MGPLLFAAPVAPAMAGRFGTAALGGGLTRTRHEAPGISCSLSRSARISSCSWLSPLRSRHCKNGKAWQCTVWAC